MGDRHIAAYRQGASMDLVVDTRGPDGEDSAVLLYISKGNEKVGNAVATCVKGCTCERVFLEGMLQRTYINQFHADVIFPTAH